MIGRNAVVRKAILDKNVTVPDGAKIGVDLAADAQKYTLSDNGCVVIGKGAVVGSDGSGACRLAAAQSCRPGS